MDEAEIKLKAWELALIACKDSEPKIKDVTQLAEYILDWAGHRKRDVRNSER